MKSRFRGHWRVPVHWRWQLGPGDSTSLNIHMHWNRVFLSVMKDFLGHKDEGVYESKDNGVSWKRITKVPIPFEMAIDPSAKSTVLYVASQGMGVYKVWEESTDKWRTEIFADKRNGLDNTRVWSVTVCPHNPKRIYVATHGTGVFVGE